RKAATHRTARGSSTNISFPKIRRGPSASGWSRGSRSLQSQRHARRDARLGRGQRTDGPGARRQGLSLSVRVRRERRPYRSHRQAADTAPGARIRVEGLSAEGDETMTRREFLYAAGAGTAIGLMTTRTLRADPLGIPIGSQTYPVRARIAQGEF